MRLYQILRRNVAELVELISEQYQQLRGLQQTVKEGFMDEATRTDFLNLAIDDAFEEWFEQRGAEYTADLRFLLLVYAQRRYKEMCSKPEKHMCLLEREFYGAVTAELLNIKARYERTLDETSEEYKGIVRDDNEWELSDRLVDLTFACLREKNWKPFDDWRRSDLYKVAVVSLGQ